MSFDIEKEAERRALERYRKKMGKDAPIPTKGQHSLPHVTFWEALYRDAIDELAKEAKAEVDFDNPEAKASRRAKGCVGGGMFGVVWILMCYVIWRFLF